VVSDKRIKPVHCVLFSDRKGPIKNLSHLSPEVLLQRSWRKTEGNWITQIDLELDALQQCIQPPPRHVLPVSQYRSVVQIATKI